MKNAASQAPGPGRVGKAGRLTRDRVIEAGLQIIRCEGRDALTMKRVAETLGSGLMTIYHHVQDRDDLIQGLMDHVANDIPHPPEAPSPAEELVSILTALYTAMRHDSWTVRYLIDGYPGSPALWPLIERIALALEGLGLDGAEAGHAYYSLIHYTYGEVLVMDAFDRGLSADREYILAFEEECPAISRTIGVASFKPSDGEPYERNLRRLICSMTS